MLEKTYEPASVEDRIYETWQQGNAFAAGAGKKPGAESFTVAMPPPNVTGSLHIGHALNHTLQDVLVRFERMRGKDVLWQPGTDHAGIATQMIVERRLAAAGEPSRREMGREKFLEKVWEWKEESGGSIINQLKKLGASADWSRERFTMDEGLSAAVIKVFVQLHKEGLIYRDKRLVNWHPGLQTAVSDLEVENIDVNGHMWHLRYPLADGVTYEHPVAFDEDGKPTEFETRNYIVVATTRPETMLGDAAVAVHPEDERYTGLVGKHVELPIVGRRIQIVADEYSDPTKGTGAVKITPAHDFNDFEVGRRHNLEAINIFTAEAKINDLAPAEYQGMDRFDARKKVISTFEEIGLLDMIEDRLISVPHDEKSKAIVIEPFLTDQWFVNAAELAKPALASVKEGRTGFVPKNWENTYYAWLENIQPWCVSRQLWWGHQIPAWYGPDGTFFVEQTEEEAKTAAKAHYGSDVELSRDPDVLDTWFSSALWPFATLDWPNDAEALKTYYPTSVLVTGFDIIFFWVARMMMFGIHFMGEEPFKKVYMHALVRDEHGQKMSKTKGNVIDPLVLINEYGADATRFTLTAMAAQGRDLRLAISRVEGYRNFVTKIWNASRFLEMNECIRVEGFDPAAVKAPLSQWIVGSTSRAVAAITKSIEDYKFNEASNHAYDFVWGTFCDWFVELAKPVFNGEDEATKAEVRATAAWTLDQILKMLHPFMPFITEELWTETGKVGPARDAMLILSSWPELDGLEYPAADAEISWLLEVIASIRSVRMEMNVPAGAKVPFVVVGANPITLSRVETHRSAISRMARVASIEFSDAVPSGSAQVIVGEATWALPLADLIDVDAEKLRLGKDLKKLEGEIIGLDKKLTNEQFLAKAPEEVVAEQRGRLNECIEKREKLNLALARLNG